MTEKLIFKQSSIENAEAEYNKVSLSKDRKERIASYVHLISRHIPLPERALKGFIWIVLKEFQTETHQKISEEIKRDVSKAEIIEGTKMVFSMLKDHLTKILVSKEQAHLLDKAFEEIMDVVIKQYKV
ncbi:MAG: hypothetical protein ACFFAS_01310 [Promethearchaeota archaeon]